MVMRATHAINNALDVTCPLTNGYYSDPNNTWFTALMGELRQEVERRYQKQRSPTPSHVAGFHRCQSKYKRECRKRKNRAWKSHMNATTSPAAAARLLKSLQHRDQPTISSFTTPLGVHTGPGEDNTAFLMDSHFPHAQPAFFPHYVHTHVLTTHLRELNTDVITPSLVHSSLAVFNSRKIPGPDGGRPVVFSYLTDGLVDLSLIHI